VIIFEILFDSVWETQFTSIILCKDRRHGYNIIYPSSS